LNNNNNIQQNLSTDDLIQRQNAQFIYSDFIQSLKNNKIGPYYYDLKELMEYNIKQDRLLKEKELKELIKDEEKYNITFKSFENNKNNVLHFMPSKQEYDKYYKERKERREKEEKKYLSFYEYEDSK
jgi:hypothetical protein